MASQNEKQKRPEQRKAIYVDADIQSALLKQIAMTWLTVLGVVASVLLAVESYKADFTLDFFGCVAAMWEHNAALVVTLAAMAPVVIYDSLRLSHRFVGPMVSFRRALTRLGEGESVEPIRFRKGDFWHDLAARFNRVLERVNRLEATQDGSSAKTNSENARDVEPVSAV